MSRWRIRLGGAGTSLLLLIPATVTAAAVAAPADLGAVLAAPADPSYKAVPNGYQGLGSVDAMSFATSSSNVSGALFSLVRERFTRGFRKGWTQQSTGMIVVETVYEFESASGAQDLFAQLKAADQGSPGLFDTPGLDQAYGVRSADSSGFQASSVAFVKGNLLFIVNVGGKSDPGTTLALEQAIKARDFAPASTVDPNGILDSADTRIVMPLVLLSLVVLVGIPLLLVLAARLLLQVRARRRRARTPERPALWDGTRWRSPDGSHWFDGVAWRPMPPAG